MPTADLTTMWSSLQMQLDAHRKVPGGDPAAVGRRCIPVTLLTGFLGAGKSTLLAALLADPPDDLRIQALVNDVGSLSFDPTLVSSASAVTVELSNGCGCCAATGEVAQSLRGLAKIEPDLIVLEASGVADPLGVAHVVEANPHLLLDRIVAAVDAVGFPQLFSDPAIGPVLQRQLDAAHIVALTHADQLAVGPLQEVIARVESSAPGRVIMTSDLASPAIDVITPGGVTGARPMPAFEEAAHRLATATMHLDTELTKAELVAAMGEFRPGIVRVKGRLLVRGHPHLVQMTPSVLTVTPCDVGELGVTIVATDETQVNQLATRIRSS